MTAKEYIDNFRKRMGYFKKDYFPKHSYKTIANWLDDELKLQMPTDTAAREVEGDAVFLLVASDEPDAIEIGKHLGDILMNYERDTTGNFKEKLLDAMKDAAEKLHELGGN